MIQIYGSPRSSAGRCYVMLEEVGVAYEQKPLDLMEKKEHKTDAFLKLNPNGKIPVLVDHEFIIWESMAINHYLAEKYKPELLGKNPHEKGHVQQWSYWGILELQPPMIENLIQMFFVPEPKRDFALMEKNLEKIPVRLAILNQALAGRSFLVGGKFTMADLNVASIVGIAEGLQVSLESFPNINKWYQSIKNRPSFQKFAEPKKK
jgi:glutathione S-transferase